MEALGGMPERTPLNAKVVGAPLKGDGYTIEKLIFESMPKFYVTASVFVPDRAKFKPPYPAVLIPSGHHWQDAKAWHEYQSMGTLCALNGMVAMTFDPILECERKTPQDLEIPTHDFIGIGSVLVGRNVASYEVWDGMRGIDYLQSRKDVDANRIGCTGNSGGGTQTSYLMSLDERITAAAPSCYIGRMGSQTRGSYGDSEQQIFGQLEFGMDQADYLMMQAPRLRVLILSSTQDFFDINAAWWSFRYAKRLYSRLGFAERIEMLENDEPHNYNKDQREGAMRWMSRWLLGKDEAITEPQLKLFTTKELNCTANGNVMELEGAKTVFDLNREYEEKQLRHARQRLWAQTDKGELLNKVRETASIRRLADLPEPAVSSVGKIESDGCTIEKLILEPEEGIYLPALLYKPSAEDNGEITVYVNEKGKAAGRDEISKLVKAGQMVLAVDLRGTGETSMGSTWNMTWTLEEANYRVAYDAYLLGRSLMGMRAEDVLVCARYAAKLSRTGKANLFAVGYEGVPALHAAVLEQQLFGSVKLKRTLVSWSDVLRHSPPALEQNMNMVHGVLRVYDLPDLAGLLGEKLSVEEPLDGALKPAATR